MKLVFCFGMVSGRVQMVLGRYRIKNQCAQDNLGCFAAHLGELLTVQESTELHGKLMADGGNMVRGE